MQELYNSIYSSMQEKPSLKFNHNIQKTAEIKSAVFNFTVC